ncbi:MAG: metal-dependent hydrolase, partial [Vicinamibacterales bacterium]
MDNLCHTLVGAALGEAGLKRRTRFGCATLMIASNLPDLDVLVFATDAPAVAFRRGWTHGLVGQALLPVALTLAMVAVARLRPAGSPAAHSARLGETADHAPPVSVRWLLLLSYLGTIVHVLFDLLNNYGVRLLSPLDWRWFYGDTLFIVDPWMWLMLGAGVWIARRRSAQGAARVALQAAVLYVVVMLSSTGAARDAVANAWESANATVPRALMVGPVPVTPLRRVVIVDAGDRYVTGTFGWLPTTVHFDSATVAKNEGDPRVAAARSAPDIQAFLVWSRFPYWTLD